MRRWVTRPRAHQSSGHLVQAEGEAWFKDASCHSSVHYNILLEAKHFLVVEGFDPRIHAVFFCPQLYKYDSEKKLVPLQGDEIGRLIANALEGGINERRPWYGPSEKLPDRPIFDAPMKTEFDTLVVDLPNARSPTR